MRVVFDTNVLVSALITPQGPADHLYQAWRGGRFRLYSSEEQLEEFRRVTHYPELKRYLHPASAGAMINLIRRLADTVQDRPHLSVSPDPNDNFLLALSEAGQVDYLVTGDKNDLFDLKRHHRTHIVTVRHLLRILEKK